MAGVALAVGSSVLSAFLQVVFDRMATKEFVNLFRERENDKELLWKLKTNLRAVGAVLDDAENKQTSNPSIREWLDELHDTIYEADDLLDEVNTEALRLKVEAEYHSSTSQDVDSSLPIEMMHLSRYSKDHHFSIFNHCKMQASAASFSKGFEFNFFGD